MIPLPQSKIYAIKKSAEFFLPIFIIAVAVADGSEAPSGRELAPKVTEGERGSCVSRSFSGLPRTSTPTGERVFRFVLSEKENGTVMYQQASPFGDKRQVVGATPSP